MNAYSDISKKSADLLIDNFAKKLEDGKEKKEVLFEALEDFQRINNIKYPYSHMEITLLISFAKTAADTKPIFQETLNLPPILTQEGIKMGETVNLAQELDQLDAAHPAVVVKIAHFIYAPIMKSVTIGTVIIGDEAQYHKYIEIAKEKLGALTRAELMKEYEKEQSATSDDASATQDKIPSPLEVQLQESKTENEE